MNLTTDTKRTYRIRHKELIEHLGIDVSDHETAEVSSNTIYVFVTVSKSTSETK